MYFVVISFARLGVRHVESRIIYSLCFQQIFYIRSIGTARIDIQQIALSFCYFGPVGIEATAFVIGVRQCLRCGYILIDLVNLQIVDINGMIIHHDIEYRI